MSIESSNLPIEDKMDVCEDEPPISNSPSPSSPPTENIIEKDKTINEEDIVSVAKDASHLDQDKEPVKTQVENDGKQLGESDDEKNFSSYINSLSKLTQDVLPNKLDDDEDVEMSEAKSQKNEISEEGKIEAGNYSATETELGNVDISKATTPEEQPGTSAEKTVDSLNDDVLKIEEAKADASNGKLDTPIEEKTEIEERQSETSDQSESTSHVEKNVSIEKSNDLSNSDITDLNLPEKASDETQKEINESNDNDNLKTNPSSELLDNITILSNDELKPTNAALETNVRSPIELEQEKTDAEKKTLDSEDINEMDEADVNSQALKELEKLARSPLNLNEIPDPEPEKEVPAQEGKEEEEEEEEEEEGEQKKNEEGKSKESVSMLLTLLTTDNGKKKKSEAKGQKEETDVQMKDDEDEAIIIDEASASVLDEQVSPLLKEVFTKISDLENDGVIISSNSQITIIKKPVGAPAVASTREEQKSDTKSSQGLKIETDDLLCNEEISIDKVERKSPIAKECLNWECKYKGTEFCEAPDFVLSHFKVNRKQKNVFVCDECFSITIAKYGQLCGALEDQQPLYLQEIPKRADLVEILDSSDEEDDTATRTDQSIFNKIRLDADTRSLIEKELEDVIIETFNRVNIDQQMKWNREILGNILENQQRQSQELKRELNGLQKTADNIYHKLYTATSHFSESMPSWDSTTGRQYVGADYPPRGKLEYPELNTSSLYYGVRSKLLNCWIPCRILKQMPTGNGGIPCYEVKFLRPCKNVVTKSVPISQIAYGKAPEVRLNVGVRVIALFNDPNKKPGGQESSQNRLNFFPGIIAEPLQEYNNWRYLIFFDDGYAQYVIQENIRVVCSSNKHVWEEVYPSSSEFIKTYLKQFSSRRPMVQVRKGQRLMTEWSGKWYNARVHNVDGSLVQMYFEENKRLEWIYRGSTRLGPLFRQQQTQSMPRRNEPSIEYVSIDANSEKAILSSATVSASTTTQLSPKPPVKETPVPEKRAVAKKSSSQAPRPLPVPTVQHLNNSTIYVDEDNKPKGKVVYYTAKKHLPPKKFVAHTCGTSCLFEVMHNLKSYSPLSKPLLSGWERQICKSKAKKCVIYRAPCGRRLRNMSELHRYLRMTNCPLNVENFDYDFLIHCLAEYVIDNCIVQKADISDGIENMVVPCVNYYDNSMPPACTYSAKRIPTEDVHLNVNKEYLCGCDCEDDCLDKTKCQCWQLTIAGAKFGNPNTPPEEVGYEFKRLPEPVPTGIYECNANCKCKPNCLNRVAQQSLQMKLQVFKTVNRGWGLRCLNDVPKGSFICCYAGHLLTEQHANEAGENLGDEYFAELDYIEVVENLKEGYEPDVVNDDDLTDDDYDPRKEDRNREDDSDDEFISNIQINNDTPIKTRYRTRHSLDAKLKNKEEAKTTSSLSSNGSIDKLPRNSIKTEENDLSDEESGRQLMSFTPSMQSMMPADKDMEHTKYKSIRKFYGKNESVYIMDAKKSGNIGRYFNHSCQPNLFVQNVFVDTHDLRFPWVAFFALSHIRAGTELTWNYNYDVGSVPGKVLYCQCGSEQCRGRLL